MVINSKKYSGVCSCGKEHLMTTELCVIEAGCLARADEYIKEYGFSGRSAAIYDENTYNAEGLIRPRADIEIILPAECLHANERGVELLATQIPADCGYLIAVGSGTIHDLTRYCAHERNIPFISCPTAASVDGFCSSVAAMTWHGYKKTFTAVAPRIVLADLRVISKAPMRLSRSGFGDMIGKFIALSDWKISNILTDEYFCHTIYSMTLEATKAVLESADGIAKGDLEAFEHLTYGLLLSGVAMQLLGNSRCASGAEHHISHLIEMQPKALGLSSSALHGEKVGVGTLLACGEYKKLRRSTPVFSDYLPRPDAEISNIFGGALGDAVIKENSPDACLGITAELLEKKWSDICAVIDAIPDEDSLIDVYKKLDMVSSLTDIEVSEGSLRAILEYAPLARNRLTLLRLRRAIEV